MPLVISPVRTISETQLDVYGHVNNAGYLSIFEEARWDWLNSKGLGLEELKRLGEGPIVLELQLKYLKELKARDKIQIETRVEAFQGKVSKIHQSIVFAEGPKKGEVSAAAVFIFGIFDFTKRKLLPPSDRWKESLKTD